MLTEVDREVLVGLLVGGDNSPSNLADITDRHPNSVGDSLDRLMDEDFVFNKGGGVYALRFSGITAARSVYREFQIELNIEDSVDELF